MMNRADHRGVESIFSSDYGQLAQPSALQPSNYLFPPGLGIPTTMPTMHSPPPSPPGSPFSISPPSLRPPLSPSKPFRPLYRLSMYLQIYEPPPRHPRQTDANYRFTIRHARRSAALSLILHIRRRTWYILGFIHRLRRPSRLRNARRTSVLSRLASPPQPMIGYDLGYDEFGSKIVIRTPTGQFITHHPSNPAMPISNIAAYSPSGDTIPLLIPPTSSRLVACLDDRCCWCYRNIDLGTTLWHLPIQLLSKSSAVSAASLPKLLSTEFTHLPPKLDPMLSLDSLDRFTSWLPLHRDSDNSITLYNKITGATRVAPWLVLRDRGTIYFANIISRETRWTPPLRWHDGWLSRVSDFNLRSSYARLLLPSSLARVHVEGGAPYLDSSGVPRYTCDASDSLHSYPLYM